MNPIIQQIKDELKVKAHVIKTLKQGRKPKNFNEELHKDLWKLSYIRGDYRHRHIAYCELRGIPRDKIENPRENNSPNESIISALKEEWMEKINETLCSNP